MRASVIQKECKCLVCGKTVNLHAHEAFFGTANRQKSIKDKMVVYLCAEHHNTTSQSVHMNRELDLKIKRLAQKKWESTYGSREDFIKRYGKSWL